MEINKLHPGNEVNDATKKAVHTRSKFEISRRRYQTMRYGELTPHFAMECVPSDKIKLRSSHDIRSYTLKAPIMSDIAMKKDYFNVPLQAILPFNADKLYTNPVQGDDVVADEVNCVVKGNYLLAYIKNLYNTLLALDPLDYTSYGEMWSVVLRNIFLMEYFLSSGSLVRQLGYSFSSFFQCQYIPKDVNNHFDYVMERILESFIADVDNKTFNVDFYGDGTVYNIDPNIPFSSENILCLKDFLEKCRQNPLITLSQTEDFKSGANLLKLYDVNNIETAYLINCSLDVPTGATPNDFNFLRVCAYQIVCHHFYSNDHIDYIYSAELFRQLMSTYVNANTGFATFQYNGIDVQYDYLSGYYLTSALSQMSSNDIVIAMTVDVIGAINYISALFSFRRSLKYVDYFTGARSQPLAVGDVSVAVASNLVNVVDVTKKLQVQRFLNSVNRAGRKLVQYISDLFGITPAYDYHDPAFLAHTSDSIHVVENENTGDAQWTQPQSVTGLFRSNAERYTFEFEADRPSIIIGITYYDIPRCYCFTNDKQNMHVDRFDMFNPFMQFIGDQSIVLSELGQMSDKPFAYTLRNMEYKQTFDIACGGFVDNLPAFAFIQPLQDITGLDHISPNWIRAHNYELDNYYLSLTGLTLASYFHFIVVNTNYVDASRPMAYAPSIL